VTLAGVRNAWVIAIEVWLGGVADDLARVMLAPPEDTGAAGAVHEGTARRRHSR
jgi:hypothetical protein